MGEISRFIGNEVDCIWSHYFYFEKNGEILCEKVLDNVWKGCCEAERSEVSTGMINDPATIRKWWKGVDDYCDRRMKLDLATDATGCCRCGFRPRFWSAIVEAKSRQSLRRRLMGGYFCVVVRGNASCSLLARPSLGFSLRDRYWPLTLAFVFLTAIGLTDAHCVKTPCAAATRRRAGNVQTKPFSAFRTDPKEMIQLLLSGSSLIYVSIAAGSLVTRVRTTNKVSSKGKSSPHSKDPFLSRESNIWRRLSVSCTYYQFCL